MALFLIPVSVSQMMVEADPHPLRVGFLFIHNAFTRFAPAGIDTPTPYFCILVSDA